MDGLIDGWMNGLNMYGWMVELMALALTNVSATYQHCS